MIILNEKIIHRIEGMKKLEKLRIFFRFIYICVLIIGTACSIISGTFEEFSPLIVICLLSTYSVSVVTDCYISDFDSVLQVLEYERHKWSYENSDVLKNGKEV